MTTGLGWPWEGAGRPAAATVTLPWPRPSQTKASVLGKAGPGQMPRGWRADTVRRGRPGQRGARRPHAAGLASGRPSWGLAPGRGSGNTCSLVPGGWGAGSGMGLSPSDGQAGLNVRSFVSPWSPAGISPAGSQAPPCFLGPLWSQPDLGNRLSLSLLTCKMGTVMPAPQYREGHQGAGGGDLKHEAQSSRSPRPGCPWLPLPVVL